MDPPGSLAPDEAPDRYLPLPTNLDCKISPAHWLEDFDVNDVEAQTQERVNTYIHTTLARYTTNPVFDQDLLEQFQEDYEGWKQTTFALGTKTLLGTLRQFLEQRGVRVLAPSGNGGYAGTLFRIVKQQKFHEWTSEEITAITKKYGEKDWMSRFNPYYGQDDARLRRQTTIAPSPRRHWSPDSYDYHQRGLNSNVQHRRGRNPIRPEDQPRPSVEDPGEDLYGNGDNENNNNNPSGPPGRQETVPATPRVRDNSTLPDPTPSRPRKQNARPRTPEDAVRPRTMDRDYVPPHRREDEGYFPQQFNSHPRWEQPRGDFPEYTDDTRDAQRRQKSQIDLSKIYRDNDKYSGHSDDVLDEKLCIFYEHCKKAGVQPSEYKDAFSTMLKGEALSYYYDTLIARSYGFKVMTQLLRGHFETPERERAHRQTWNTLRFEDVIRKNPTKSMTECLEEVIKTLRHSQRRISGHQTEWDLREQLITACKSVPQCDVVLLRPSHSYEAVCADLRAACGNADARSEKQGAYWQSYEDIPEEDGSVSDEYGGDAEDQDIEAYFVDRKYGGGRFGQSSHQRVGFRDGNAFRGNSRPRGGYGSYRGDNRGMGMRRIPSRRDFQNPPRYGNPPQRGRPRLDPDTCNVCFTKGCHSSKHSEAEIRTARMQYRNTAYISEGREVSDKELDEVFFLQGPEGAKEDEPPREPPKAGRAFFTELQSNTEVDGPTAVAYLQDQAIWHALTKEDVYPGAPEPPEIMFVEERYSAAEFRGIMPDTGASGLSTIGRPQFEALQRMFPELKEEPANGQTVTFGKGSAEVSGCVVLPTPLGKIRFFIVPAPTPALWCLQDMDHLGVRFDNLTNTLVQGTTRIPIIREWGHPWWIIGNRERTLAFCHFTEQELRRLHRRFGHPSARKLWLLLDRTGVKDLSTETLAEINRACRHCQMNEKKPGRFLFTIKDDLEFNHTFQLDIFYMDGKPYLHGIDGATGWNVCAAIPDESAATIWNTARYLIIDMLQGPPREFLVDAGRNFNSEEFKAHAKSMDVTVRSVPVEAHNSVGKIERAHAPLRRAFTILREELKHQKLSDKFVLQMAVKAVNDTAGPNGLVPTLLVFGAYPRITDDAHPPMTTVERGKAVRKAMREVRQIHAERAVKDALQAKSGPDVSETLNLPLFSNVRVWREGTKSIRGHWSGPHKLLAINDYECVVEMPHGPSTFRCTVVRPYRESLPEQDGDKAETNKVPDPKSLHPDGSGRPRPSTMQIVIPRISQRNLEAQSQPSVHLKEVFAWMTEIQNREDNSRLTWIGSYMQGIESNIIREHRGMQIMAFLTQKEKDDAELAKQLRYEGKITTPGEPFELSRKTEVDSLIAGGVFEFVQFDETVHEERVFKSRLVDEVKGKGTERPYEKSRLVIQAYNDRGKEEILTQSPTIQRSAQRLILTIAPSGIRQGMTLFSRDITQAYVQATSTLARVILAELPISIRHLYPEGTIMKVIKPLYGIPEAGTHWYVTYAGHYESKLDMEPSTYDPCLFITRKSEVFGLAAMQTDDTLILGDDVFMKKEDEELHKAKLLAKPIDILSEANPLIFNGCIVRLVGDCVTIKQKNQGAKLQLVDLKLPPAERLRAYREQRARGAYIATICQPEASFDLSVAAQHQEPSDEDVKALNKRLQWQIENQDRGLTNIPLDLATLKLFVFVDGSFANNQDLSSQLGYVILLANELPDAEKDTFHLRGNIMHFSSTKSKRVTRAVLASEIYGMVLGVDIAIAINSTLQLIAQRLGIPPPPIVCCTDSYSLYECLVKLGTTKEKRLMIDIMALRQSYERRELQEIRWIKGDDNPADAMTKSTPNSALRTLVDSNELVVRVEGWVNRQEK